MKKRNAPRAKAKLPQPSTIRLDARLSIAQAVLLHGELSKRVVAGAPINIDGSAVEEIDTAILQLLAGLWRSCAQRQLTCTWLGVSNALRHTATLIGVSELLHFPALGPSQDQDHAAT